MEWEIITKEIRNDKGLIVVVETDEQIDEVGNIYQRSGGVIPKACQKCKTEFKSTIKIVPQTQKVPIYFCEECDFSNAGTSIALDHKIDTNHKLKKSFKDRIVSYSNIIEGSFPKITQLKDDCLILCQKCDSND